MIKYAVENDLEVDEFRTILLSSSLSLRRPIDNLDRLRQMLRHSNLILTARDQGKLIGVARSLTDFGFCTYLSDLAVDLNYQKQGIGKELIRQTKRHTPMAKLILLAAPAAETYYPKIGMKHFNHCYILTDEAEIF